MSRCVISALVVLLLLFTLLSHVMADDPEVLRVMPRVKIKRFLPGISPKTVIYYDYAKAKAAAINENRPLVIFVGDGQPIVDKRWAACCLKTWARTDGKKAVTQGIVVGKPDGKGDLNCTAEMDCVPDLANVEKGLKK